MIQFLNFVFEAKINQQEKWMKTIIELWC
jgi:hypothetical protein